MNTTRYQSIGSKAFSAGMMAKAYLGTSKATPADPSAQGDTWWSNWDEKWINHYDEEWMAFISEHPKRADRVAEERLPRVWNPPEE